MWAIIAVMAYVVWYITLSFFINEGWAVAVAALLALLTTYYITRRSWEKKILNGLSKQDQDFFFDSIAIGNPELEQMLESDSENPNLRANAINHVTINVIVGLADLTLSESQEAASLLAGYGNNPFSREFISELDNRFSKRYVNKFGNLVSRYQSQHLTLSIPFPRMYKWALKTKIRCIDHELRNQGKEE